MDKLILNMVKEGKDVNDVLNMPFHFVMELLSEQHKPKQAKSLISAFGG